MKIKYHILNELSLEEYGTTQDQADGQEWLDKHIQKNTFGKPERDIIHRKEMISGGNVNILQNSFPIELSSRVLSESSRFTDLTDMPAQENPDEIQYKIYTRRVKSDYVITETDVTAEENEKEQKEIDKKAKKAAAIVTLSGILSLDLSKKKDVEKAIRAIVEHLEIEIVE